MRLKYEENHHSEQENTIYTTSASSPLFSVSRHHVFPATSIFTGDIRDYSHVHTTVSQNGGPHTDTVIT